MKEEMVKDRVNYFAQLSTMMVEKGIHVGHLIHHCLKEKPDAICQVDAATGEHETNASAFRRSVRLARFFRKLGLGAGDILALSGRNHLDQQTPYVAAMMTGLAVTGIDPNFKIDELKDVFKITEPKIAFCEPESYDDYVRASRELGLTTKVVTYGKGEHSMKQLVETYDDDSPIEDFEVATLDRDEAVALLVISGGTTVVLKVAAITHGAWMYKMNTMLSGLFENKAWEDKPYQPALNLSSIQWISGLFLCIGMPLMHQTKIQTSAPATAEHVVDIINKYRPVTAMFNPSFATSLLKCEKPCDFSCFQNIIVTGGKVFKDTLLGLRAKVGEKTRVIESYGQTENLGPVFMASPIAPVGSCGKPFPGLKVKLVDPETGKEITEPNVTGELWTKGVGFSGYYKNPEETANAVTEDGWFKTGDLMYRDENDYYFFVERLKMLIKYRNYQIIPPELEAVIRSHPGVLDVSVTSVPHADDGEHPVACVVTRPGCSVTAQEIKDLVADKLSDVKQLRGGVIFLDKIPLTHAGKVARGYLRKLVLNMHRE